MNLASTQAPVAARPRASSASTASSAPRPTSGIPTSSTTTTRSSSRRRPRRATTSATDITDKALEFIRDAKAVAPDKPFFLYYCPGACHAPHHAPKEWVGPVQGQVRHGLRGLPRAGVRSGRRSSGSSPSTPSSRRSTPTPTETSADGKAWPELDTVRPWDSLSDDEKRLFAGWPRCTPASSATPTTRSAGCSTTWRRAASSTTRMIVAGLRQRRLGRGRAERFGQREQDLQRPARHDRGEPAVPRRARQPADLQPLPDRLGVGVQHAVQAVEALRELRGRHRRPDDRLLADADHRARASARSTPTPSTSSRRSTSASASSRPRRVKGYTQHPLEGVSFAATLRRSRRRDRQADAVLLDGRHPGDLARGLEGGGAVAGGAGRRGPTSPSQRWELFDTDNDPSECHDLADEHPEQAPGAHRPVVDRGGPVQRAAAREPRTSSRSSATERPQLVEAPRAATSTTRAAPRCPSRSRRTSATARTRSPSRSTSTRPRRAGVLFSQGARFGGHALYLKDGKLKYVYNWVGEFEQIVESTEPIPAGPRRRSPRRSSGRATRCPPRAPSPSTSATSKVGEAPDQDPARQVLASPARASTSAGTAASRSPTTTPGESPWPFVGGTIQRAVVDVSGEPFVDLAQEGGHGLRPRLNIGGGAHGDTGRVWLDMSDSASVIRGTAFAGGQSLQAWKNRRS